MTIEQQILEQIDAADSRDPQRNIKHFRDRILSEITARQRFEERRGIVTDKFGREINLKETVMTAIDSSYYIGRASNAEEKAKFVSKWAKPTQEQRQKIASEVSDVIENLVKLNSIVPLDKGSFQKAVSVLSKNLVYGYSDETGEVVFHKLNANGIAGSIAYSFNDILPSPLIDHNASHVERELQTATYREVAKKIITVKNPRDEVINEKIEQLKRRDILAKVPKRSIPQIPKSQLHDEYYRREAILRGLDPATQGGQAGHVLRQTAKQEMEKLDDLRDVQKELDSIKPAPAAQWDALPYE